MMRDDLNKFFEEKDENTNPFAYTDVSEKELREYCHLFEREMWSNISCYQTLSETFIREFKNKIDWDPISAHQSLSEQFIIEHKDYVNWEYVCKFQKVTAKIIDRCYEYINWEGITLYQKLNIDTIKRYKKHFFKNDHIIAMLIEHQELPEEFIKKNKKLYSSTELMDGIIKFQNISTDFRRFLLREYRKKLMEFVNKK